LKAENIVLLSRAKRCHGRDGQADMGIIRLTCINGKVLARSKKAARMERFFFHFSTEPLSDHRVNWFHLHSFEHCIFFSERELRGNPYRANADDPNHVVYFELGLAVDRQAVVDYLGELIAGAIAETDDARVLSEIGIPSLDIDYLRNHGLVADSEGQIALAELAE